MSTTPSLTARELAAILAGLRLLEAFTGETQEPLQRGTVIGYAQLDAIDNIRTNGNTQRTLSPDEIGELCARLNTARQVAILPEGPAVDVARAAMKKRFRLLRNDDARDDA